MQNLQSDPIHRNAERRKNARRMKLEKRRGYVELVANIKILGLWLLYVIMLFVFIAMVESALPYRIILKWIIIISFVGVTAPAVYNIEKKIKKSLRHCNAVKGQAK